MNVDFASVGNHEFDKGSAELQRIQNGGCHPVPPATGCTAAPYALADGGDAPTSTRARTSSTCPRTWSCDATGKTLFPAFGDQAASSRDSGKKFAVGFIGEVLEARRRSSRRRESPA